MKNIFLKNLSAKNKLFQYFSFSIFIKTQSTPNPHFLKFSPGKEILEEGETYEFSNEKQALVSPLATKLFDVYKIYIKIKGVTKVFYGRDYVSVGKQETLDWSDVKPFVVDIMCDYFTKNLELFDNNKLLS